MSSINRKILTIMSLALEISPPEMVQTGKKTHVFASYSPHCNQFEIIVYLKGWGKEKNPDYWESFYANRSDASKKADEIIKYLENILKAGGVIG